MPGSFLSVPRLLPYLACANRIKEENLQINVLTLTKPEIKMNLTNTVGVLWNTFPQCRWQCFSCPTQILDP